VPNERDVFITLFHMDSGSVWEREVELSPVTRLFVIGCVTARQYLPPRRLTAATKKFMTRGWPWRLTGGKTFDGLDPETAFWARRWHTSASDDDFLLPISAPITRCLPDAWNAWTRPTEDKYQGIEYNPGNEPDFPHQLIRTRG